MKSDRKALSKTIKQRKVSKSSWSSTPVGLYKSFSPFGTPREFSHSNPRELSHSTPREFSHSTPREFSRSTPKGFSCSTRKEIRLTSFCGCVWHFLFQISDCSSIFHFVSCWFPDFCWVFILLIRVTYVFYDCSIMKYHIKHVLLIIHSMHQIYMPWFSSRLNL